MRAIKSYGNIKEIPVKKSELTNDTKEGCITVDAITVDYYEDKTFISVVAKGTLISVRAGYIANDLHRYAPVLNYPFELKWKKKDGKNVIA